MDYEKIWLEKIEKYYSEQNERDMLFNWWENPDECLITIDKELLQIILNLIKEKFGDYKHFKNINNLSHKIIFQLKNKNTARIKSLKIILSSLNIKYSDCSKNILKIGGSKYTFKINFPVNLNNSKFVILIAAFMSDGHNSQEHPFYANLGFLGEKIKNSANLVLPDLPYETRNEKLRFHAMLGRMLYKLGVPYGCKTKINPFTPKFVYYNTDYSKIYLTQVFDDEGHAPTKTSRKIVLGRSCLINLEAELNYLSYVTYNQLTETQKQVVLDNPPNLLICEYFMLKKFGINSSIRCRKVTRYLKGISADWVIEIFGKGNIHKFNKNIGFSEPKKVKISENYTN